MKNFYKQFSGIILAATTGTTDSSSLSGAPGVDLTIQRVIDIFTGLICWVSRVAGVLIVGAFIFYGIQMVISRGDPGQVTKARESLTFALVGTIVILGVYAIIATVANAVGADTHSLLPLHC